MADDLSNGVMFKDGPLEGYIGFETLGAAMGFIYRLELKERRDPAGRYAYLADGPRAKHAERIREDAQCRASLRAHRAGEGRPVDEFLAELSPACAPDPRA